MNKEEIKRELESKSNMKVAMHHDADGLGALVLAKKVLDISEVFSPDKFGDYSYISHEKNTEGDIVEKKYSADLGLDLGQPIDSKFNGILIDHHNHPNPWYKLIHDRVPTGLIVYNLWKDKIPKEETWKLCVSLVGDGQPELIPNEIFDNNPFLLNKIASVYKTYGKLKLYDYPLYSMLSSPINSMCRTGNIIPAYKLLLRAKDPLDVLGNEIAKNDVMLVRKEEERIFKEYNNLNIVKDHIVFHRFRSKFRMCGRIATKLQVNDRNRTYVVLNEEKKSLSIRGNLAYYIGTKLNAKGFTAGGHYGYFGGSLKDNQTARDLLEALRNVF